MGAGAIPLLNGEALKNVQPNPRVVELRNRHKKRMRIIEEYLSGERGDAQELILDLQDSAADLEKKGTYRITQLKLEKCGKRQKLLIQMMEETMAQENHHLWGRHLSVEDEFSAELSVRCNGEYKLGDIDLLIAQEWQANKREMEE